MTCEHVLGLIDAGPLADYPPAHLDAARQHARQCAGCGSALEAATALTANLAALPLPLPPRELSGIVLARIAQVESETRAEAPKASHEGGAGWPEWATALGSLMAGVGFLVSRMEGEPAGVLAASLVLYAAGLFGMPRDRAPQ